ncbi:ependymin [Neosynchiropus ocellatus]
MYAATLALVLACWTATTLADHHLHPCHSPNMTGHMSVMNFKGEVKGIGSFTFDTTAKRLRFKTNDSIQFNSTHSMDLLMLLDEGIFYEIDSKNQSCEKKPLHVTVHPMDIPDDATFMTEMNLGSAVIEGEGMKVNLWGGVLPESKVAYTKTVTMGCLPVSSVYTYESGILIFTMMNIDMEIKDPEQLVVPSCCQAVALEETPEGTVHSFMNEFI